MRFIRLAFWSPGMGYNGGLWLSVRVALALGSVSWS